MTRQSCLGGPCEEAKLGGGTPPLRLDGGWLVLHHGVAGRLEPELPAERQGVVPNVVFPTAIDRRAEDVADVYYGMADARIGAFRLTMGSVPTFR